jgi:hypothetical protein
MPKAFPIQPSLTAATVIASPFCRPITDLTAPLAVSWCPSPPCSPWPQSPPSRCPSTTSASGPKAGPGPCAAPMTEEGHFRP